MTEVPESPKEFFMQYLPAKFTEFRDTFSGKSSAGSMLFRIHEGDEWTIRLNDGKLEVSEGAADDTILQVTIPAKDFIDVMVEGARAQSGNLAPEAQVMALKALTVDQARIAEVLKVKGSVAFVVTDGDSVRKLVITPGNQAANVDSPECKLECQMSDFIQLQTGKQLPIQLAMSGKMRIVGDASLPMALNAVIG